MPAHYFIPDHILTHTKMTPFEMTAVQTLQYRDSTAARGFIMFHPHNYQPYTVLFFNQMGHSLHIFVDTSVFASYFEQNIKSQKWDNNYCS